MSRSLVIALLLVVQAFVPAASALAQLSSPEPSPSARVIEARRHFELGIVHFDRGQWQAALVEFLASRELSPNKANTKNAAICLRKVGRFDEALVTFEALLREFPDLPAADRELAEREIRELSASVGTLEIREAPVGARVFVDGIARAVTPLERPLRLSAGTHTVRVVKDGFLPFEARFDLPGGRAKVVTARLATLAHVGRLRVIERTGRSLAVVVDGRVVGTTPWEGAVAPGTRGVFLRGDAHFGTAPVAVSVRLNRLASLELEATALPSRLRVEGTPPEVVIAVNGAPVGRGAWEGRLSPGTHRVELTLPGYTPSTRVVTLTEGEREVLAFELEPSTRGRAGIALEVEAGVPFALLWGGDLESSCTEPCSASVGAGLAAQAHAIQRFSSGIGVGIHGGYLRLHKSYESRSESLEPVGKPLNRGVVDDHLRISGLVAGVEAEYATGTRWLFGARVQVGALIGAVSDERSGSFVDSEESRYEFVAVQSPRTSYLYVGPELRLGRKLGAHFEVAVGAKLLALAALGGRAWDERELYAAGEDGAGTFAPAELGGGTLLVLVPAVGVRYGF